MAAPRARGLDVAAQLNFVGPRSFLLQAEDDLEMFVLESAGLASEVETGAAP